jgi:HKD family nuclease
LFGTGHGWHEIRARGQDMIEYALENDEKSIEIVPTDVMTGDRNRLMQLYYQLIHSISKAKRIDIIVSFLMESGERMLYRRS